MYIIYLYLYLLYSFHSANLAQERSTSDNFWIFETALCRRHAVAKSCAHAHTHYIYMWICTMPPRAASGTIIADIDTISDLYISNIVLLCGPRHICTILFIYLNHKAGPSVFATQRCFTFLSSSRFASAACPLNGFWPPEKGKKRKAIYTGRQTSRQKLVRWGSI